MTFKKSFQTTINLTLPPTRCLALAPTNDALIVVKCDASEPTQRWRFGNFNASAVAVR